MALIARFEQPGGAYNIQLVEEDPALRPKTSVVGMQQPD